VGGGKEGYLPLLERRYKGSRISFSEKGRKGGSYPRRCRAKKEKGKRKRELRGARKENRSSLLRRRRGGGEKERMLYILSGGGGRRRKGGGRSLSFLSGRIVGKRAEGGEGKKERTSYLLSLFRVKKKWKRGGRVVSSLPNYFTPGMVSKIRSNKWKGEKKEAYPVMPILEGGGESRYLCS